MRLRTGSPRPILTRRLTQPFQVPGSQPAFEHIPQLPSNLPQPLGHTDPASASPAQHRPRRLRQKQLRGQ